MKTLIRTLGAALLALLTPFFAGCEVLSELASRLEKPTASFESMSLDDLGLESLTLGLKLRVHNPYGVSLPVEQLGYHLSSGAEPFLSGQTAPGVSIPARGSKSISLPLTVRYTELIELIAGIRPGAVVPYTAHLDVSVNAPGLGRITLPLEQQGELPVPTVPEVELTSVRWDSLSLSEAAATLKLKIGNQNEFPVELTRLSYDLSLGGKQIARTSVQSSASFQPGGSAELTIPISFSPASLGLAAFNMLMGSGSGYSIAGDLELSTPFGPLTYPYSRSGETVFRH